MFDVALLPNASFLLMTVLTVLGILLSLGLPNRLVTRKIAKYADDTDADVRRNANQRVTEASVSRIGTSPAQAIPTLPAPAKLA